MRRTTRPSPAKARGYALAAIRETFEETGLLIGQTLVTPPAHAVPSLFTQAGVYPDLASLHFIARAITPPRRPRRFDTRFFAADAQGIVHRVEGIVGAEAELVELTWVPLAEAKQLDLPSITQVVLDELEARVAAGFGHDLPVPFYRMMYRRFTRELL